MSFLYYIGGDISRPEGGKSLRLATFWLSDALAFVPRCNTIWAVTDKEEKTGSIN
jgi:hypothetical protein